MDQNLSKDPLNLQTNPNPMPTPISQKTKSKTKLIAGLVIGVLAVVGIGAGILYFAGVLTPEEKIQVDLSKMDTSATDPYMVYKDDNIGPAMGLRLDTQELVKQIDSMSSGGQSPFANPQSFISPDVCAKMKEEINAQGWKFVLSTTNPPTDQSIYHLALKYDKDSKNNQVYALMVDKENHEVNLQDAEKLLGYPLPPPRFIYDPRYIIVKNDGGIIPLAVGTTTLKAKACDLETNEMNIFVPEGIENYDPTKEEEKVDADGQVISKEISYGAYESDFLSGVAQTQKIPTNVKNAKTAKVDFTALYQKDSDGFVAMLISPDGGKTWVPQNEQEPVKVKPEKNKLSGNYYIQDNVYTFNLNDAAITDLRLIVFVQNTTKAGAKITIPEEDKTNWPVKASAAKTLFPAPLVLNKISENAVKSTQPTLFLTPNQGAAIYGGDNPDSSVAFKYAVETEPINQTGSQITALTPHYNQFIFTGAQNGGAPGPALIQPPISKLPFEFIKIAKADNALVQPQGSYVYSIMVLPDSTPILKRAVITLEETSSPITAGKLPEATPEASPAAPTLSPSIFEPTITEGQLDADFSVWHRGHNRAIVKWKFKSGASNNVDPKDVTFKYGENENNISKGTKVYKDKNDGKYYVVLRGLLGGESSDKNDGGYVNGRHPYYFQISANNKTTSSKSFKTLNRLQTIAYYYTLLLDATYLSSQDETNLEKYSSLDNTVSIGGKDQKVRDLEGGGFAFFYKPEGKDPLSLLGVKFTMANDRKFKEFDKKIDELQKGGIGVTEAKKEEAKKDGKKEVVRMFYRRILDRIYDEDLGKFYDKDGVDFWVAMTDKDLIKNYYKDKDEKDIIDMYGVKFAVSVSKEYQSEQLAGLGSDLLAQAKADFAYQIVLKRGADKPGLAFLTNNFTTAKDMRKHLALSFEYETRLADIESKSGKKSTIEELYETLYGRPSDVKGVEYWLGTGRSTFELRDTFLSSNEFTKVIKE